MLHSKCIKITACGSNFWTHINEQNTSSHHTICFFNLRYYFIQTYYLQNARKHSSMMKFLEIMSKNHEK